MFPFVEVLSLFWMPLLCGAFAVAGALCGWALRDDSPRTEWPREEP